MQTSIFVSMVALTLCELSLAAFAEEATNAGNEQPLLSAGSAEESAPAPGNEERHDGTPTVPADETAPVEPTDLMIGSWFYNPLKIKNWSVGFQSTYIWQRKPPFDAAYSGPHSLITTAETGYTLTATLFVGLRPWVGAEIFVNPEIIQNVNMSNLKGLGGFSNGESQKSGEPKPALYLARAFLRQTINIAKSLSRVEPAANQFDQKIASRRFVLTLGNLAVTDIFDLNRFSHDPRTQFMNWVLWTAGATDYAADTRGYTWGIALEYYHDDWAFRIGRFAQPRRSNGLTLDPNIFAHYGDYFEIEHDHIIAGQGGRIRMMAFNNHAKMGNFNDALAYAQETGKTPDVADVRRGQSKYGMGINFEQSITQDAGVFIRFSLNDGQTETYAYTEVERSFAVGGIVKGRLWRRPDDTVGLSYAFDGLSNAHREYLAAGGLGAFIGDGRIKYDLEHIIEVFYSLRVFSALWFSLDYQLVLNPAYNKDRGPVSFFGCRFHVEF